MELFFGKLADLVSGAWEAVIAWTILEPFEQGVIIRLGKFKREVGPGGFHWKWPFIEKGLTCCVYITTMSMESQTVTSKDGKSIILSGIVKYRIEKPKVYLLDIGDEESVLMDVTMGALEATAASHTWEDIQQKTPEFIKEAATKIRAQVNQYGFKILALTLGNKTNARTFRLIQDVASKGGEE